MTTSDGATVLVGEGDRVIYVTVGDESVFQVTVRHWPESESNDRAPAVLDSYWPPFGVSVVQGNPDRVEREFVVDVAEEASLIRFESDFGLYVSEKLVGFVAVHAALLRIDDALVIVPGTSHTGKSSLCVAAMEAGFEVWSDEYCLIDTTTGEVSGWPRPIRQRLPGGGVRRIDHPGPAGPGIATHVVTVAFLEGGEPLTVEPNPQSQVALDLMANTVCAQSRPEETFRATTALAKTVSGLTGHRGEAADALVALRAALRGGSR